VLGLLDDVALVAWFSTTLKGEMDKFHEWELTRPTVATDSNDKATAEHKATAMSGLTPINYDQDRAQPARESAKHAGASDNSTASNRSSALSESSNTHSSTPQPAAESAKQHGTHSESNTDSGLGSPESSSSAPVHSQSDDIKPTDNTSGGNVR
jgi:hypothetical protein